MDRRIAQLEARVEQLERRLGRNSRNSSLPPSQDPPGAPPRRRGKDRSGRPPGGQSGHEGHGRELLPAWAVDELVDHWPASCGCGHVFAEAERVACREPARHQVEELPQIAVRVTEHRCQRVRCPGCGVERTGELPAEVAGSAFGPRLQAAVVALSVRNRVSRRDLVELCEELFGARISYRLDRRDPRPRRRRARGSPTSSCSAGCAARRALNVDETGWRLKGAQRTLWGAFTEKIAVFKITANRHEQHLRELLADHTGDRDLGPLVGLRPPAPRRRQVCWSHLQRDFQAQAEGSGAEHELGQAGLRICERVFWAWEVYQHTHDRRQLQLADPRPAPRAQADPAPIPRQSTPLQTQPRPRPQPAQSLARALDLRRPARRDADQQPRRTRPARRRHLPQALPRQPIRARRTHASNGCSPPRSRCRLQHRSLFAYLAELLAAHARGDPPPALA